MFLLSARIQKPVITQHASVATLRGFFSTTGLSVALCVCISTAYVLLGGSGSLPNFNGGIHMVKISGWLKLGTFAAKHVLKSICAVGCSFWVVGASLPSRLTCSLAGVHEVVKGLWRPNSQHSRWLTNRCVYISLTVIYPMCMSVHVCAYRESSRIDVHPLQY